MLVLRCLCCLCAYGLCSAQAVPITGGTFEMGGKGGDNDEVPAHTVSVSSFQIDKHEVTVAQYDSCVRSGACNPAHYDDGKCLGWRPPVFKQIIAPDQFKKPDMPAVCVTWQQAQNYCRYTGRRLPTEAEWEYAALGGTRNPYAWGTGKPSGQCASAWDKGPRLVCNSSPNKWQICDMTGNAWEWVQDRYQNDYYIESAPTNPQGPEVGRYRVIRGGGWYSTPSQLRIKNRHWFSPEFSEISIGFRCVR